MRIHIIALVLAVSLLGCEGGADSPSSNAPESDDGVEEQVQLARNTRPRDGCTPMRV